MDPPGAGDDAVAGDPLLGHAEVVGLVDDEAVELQEGGGIEQELQPLARRLLAGLVLAADPLLAPAELGVAVAAPQLLEALVGGHGYDYNSVSMQPWLQAVLVACAVVLTAAAVPALLALRRMARRAETVLIIVEQELRPLIGQAHALTEDVRTLTREAKEEIERVGEVTERVNAVADGVGRAVTGLAGLARAGQLIGVAAGLKKGLDVFVSRFSKNQGDHHGK